MTDAMPEQFVDLDELAEGKAAKLAEASLDVVDEQLMPDWPGRPGRAGWR